VDAVIAVLPTLGLMLLFGFVLRAILRADRAERKAVHHLEQERLAAGTSPAEGDAPRTVN